MDKRKFMGVAALGAAALPGMAQAQLAPKAQKGPTVLTVSGLIGAGNRGALDPALDQMMAKQKIKFDKAQTFDFATLAALPAVTIKPTLEYDNKPHTLKGPLLADVLKASGVKLNDKTTVFVRAVDGYAAQVTAAELTKYRFIVATHMDGQPLSLGGLGPLWAVYDADRFPEMAAKPISARFAWCPWATYHIEVKEA
ncbi:molybdopterin-dependent oxidoreductase [Polaromonas sp. CT11-55]|uniref:molybdopterin-dependent oxidoreductase n=1 Tax=Polaromonas sp. CT11-55 TaxID=3243045 RepID=UPI0039A619A5